MKNASRRVDTLFISCSLSAFVREYSEKSSFSFTLRNVSQSPRTEAAGVPVDGLGRFKSSALVVWADLLPECSCVLDLFNKLLLEIKNPSEALGSAE